MNTIICSVNNFCVKLAIYQDQQFDDISLKIYKMGHKNDLNSHDFFQPIMKEIQSICKNNNLVYLIIPREWLTLKLTEVPSIQDDEIYQMAELQVLKAIPHNREEVIIQSIPVQKTQSSHTQLQSFILLKKRIQPLLNLFHYYKIFPEKILLSSDRICQWIREHQPNLVQPSFWISVDSNSIEILIILNYTVLQSRVISGWNHDEFPVHDIQTKIMQTLNFFKNQTPEMANIQNYFIIGNKKLSQKLAPSIEEKLQIHIEWVSHKVEIEEESVLFHELNPYGLNQNQINFLPETFNQFKFYLVAKQKLSKLIFFGIALMLLITGTIKVEYYRCHKQLQDYKQQINSQKTEAKRLELIQMKLTDFHLAKNSKGQSLKALQVILPHLPPSMFLKTIHYDDQGKLMIKGTCQQLSEVFDVVPKLNGESNFRAVTTKYARQITSANKKEVEFQINIQLESTTGPQNE